MGRTIGLLLLSAALFGCGGADGNGDGTNTPPPVTGGGTSSPPGQAQILTLQAGQTASGINIAVASPSNSPTPNAQFIGASETGDGFAFVNGTTIRRGRATWVFLGGPGLSGSMQVRISGPQDLTVSQIGSTQFSGTPPIPGIAFLVTAQANAAKGARSVLLISGNDITTFAGGLEVVD